MQHHIRKQNKLDKPINLVDIIGPKLTKALIMTLKKENGRYAINHISFNRKTQEFIATDGRTMLIVKIKSTLIEAGPFSKLETGLYEIVNNYLYKNDKEQKFPNPLNIIPPMDIDICTGYLRENLLWCMLKKQTYVVIWDYISVIKILDKVSSIWYFYNESYDRPMAMRCECKVGKVVYLIMPEPTMSPIHVVKSK